MIFKTDYVGPDNRYQCQCSSGVQAGCGRKETEYESNEVSKEYKQEVKKLRNKNPTKAKEFDNSWNQAMRGMSKEYKENHPKEYPVCPTQLKEIMENIGFSKPRIVKSPHPIFAVVIGIK